MLSGDWLAWINEMIIAVDFDGTIVEHQFPEIGAPLDGAFDWLQKFQAEGALLILYTMRSKANLLDAAQFCRLRGLEFWAINNNPEQLTWTASPKIYAHLYIDDAAFGCPLKRTECGRPGVDWSLVGPTVMEMLDRECRTGSR